MAFTRRSFCWASIAGVAGRHFLQAAEYRPVGWLSEARTAGGVRRRYRADAQILMLSVPVLHCKGVGDGSALWSDSVASNGTTERFLEFTGRSAPEHAAGLNRFGFIQELSRTADRERLESHYFGLMTSSPEESAAEARKALYTDAKEAWFSAIEGHITERSIETVSARFLAPTRTSAAERSQLMEQARQALAAASTRKQDALAAGLPPRTFLHVLADVLSGNGPSRTQYVYNGRLYHFKVEKSPDAKAARAFRELGLIGATATLARISGMLWRDGGKPTEFKLWIEEDNPHPLPLRIEYQPRNYLRLTFEAEA